MEDFSAKDQKVSDSEKQTGSNTAILFDYTFCRKTGKLNNVSSVCRKASIVDVIFLAGGSWSIWTKNSKILQGFLCTMVNGFDIREDIWEYVR